MLRLKGRIHLDFVIQCKLRWIAALVYLITR
jgi:hypothetical protein